MKLIDGRAIAQEIREELKKNIEALAGRKPGLAFILLGEDPASQAYVLMKKKRCIEVGIHSEILELPAPTSEKDLLQHIHSFNQSPHIDGILVQLPLPKHLSPTKITQAILPDKDVDGLHPLNMGKLLLGEIGGFVPCTPLGIIALLKKMNIETPGKHVVIIGRSNIVGKPLAALLMQKGSDATVTIAHRMTRDLTSLCQSADILVAAIGKPRFIRKEMVKKGAVIIDVGINRIYDPEKGKKIVGDVAFDEVKELASAITPVPGGVGPMTIAMLLHNTLISHTRRHA